MMKLPILNAGLGTMGRGRWKVEGGSDLSAYRLPPSIKRSAGLTLIEMIGVMAILSILATMMVPNIIEKIQEGQRDLEDNKLEEIAGALVKGIKAQGKLPDLTLHPTNTNGGWVAMAAPFAALGTNAIWKVYPGGAPGVTNSTARRVYFSTYLTNLLATTNTNFGMGWISNGSSRTITNSVLMFIVSSSKPDLQLACPTNANIGTNEQLWLQNWIKEYDNKGNVAATNRNIVGNVEGSTLRWTNRGQFLHVKVVDMAPYLCNVQVEDWHGPLTNIIQSGGGAANVSSLGSFSRDYPGSGIRVSYSVAVVSNSAWTNTIRIDPSTYSAGIITNNFTSRLTGGGPPDRVDGDNVWRLSGTTFRVNLDTGVNVELNFNLPAGPFFSIGTASTNRVSRFKGNPSAASAVDTRYDKHNFYVIAGTPIKLFQDQEADFPANTPNLQTVFIPKEPNHTLVYSNGIWITK